MFNRIFDRLPHYLQLMRFDKPIGWLLLLWPTLWALWLANDGQPPARLLWIFTLAVVVMRSAGCVINDIADKDFDARVERTKQRPLAAGNLTRGHAFLCFVVLGLMAIGLLLLLPQQVWPWAIPAAVLTVMYPFMKRVIAMPQLVLGLSFSFAIPMVYVASGQAFDITFWLLFIMNFIWVLSYDTAYAMSDREDDLQIGVKSTAIFFGANDKLAIGLMQLAVLALLLIVMQINQLHLSFVISIALVASLFVYQQWLIKDRDRQKCFQAFLNNGWVGGIIWFGLLVATV